MLALPGVAEPDVLLLIESIRAFAGGLSDRPVVVAVPSNLGSLERSTHAELERLEATILPFEIDSDLAAFPFAAKVVAAAAIEASQNGRTERLCFLDQDTFIPQIFWIDALVFQG